MIIIVRYITKNYRNLGTLHLKLHILSVAPLYSPVYSPVYSPIFSFISDHIMHINEDIVDIEKPDRICLLTFVVDEFSELFLHPSVFFLLYTRDLHK